MKIINYDIMRHPNPEALERAVRNAIRNGWQPFGNLTIEKILINNRQALYYIQPIVKYDE